MPLDSREQYLEKPLPSSTESERIILGAVILDESVLPQAIEHLKPEHFYAPMHRRVYAAMLALFERRERIDPIMIGEELKKDGSIDSIGGVTTITNLTFGLPHFSDITDYVKKVKELSRIRDLIQTCNQITSTALAEEDLPENVLSYAQSKINEVCTLDDKKGFIRIGAATEKVMHRAAEIKKNGVTHTGLKTGYRDWDEKTGGLQKTDLIIVAGRPGMGKSSIAANLAERIPFYNQGAVVAVFTLEMSEEQYSERILCSTAGVELQRFKNEHLIADEWKKLAEQQAILDEYIIEIDDSSHLTPLDMRSKLMRLEAKHNRLDLVIVDYLQRMSSSRRTESRQQEVSQISRDLKSIAKDLKVPVVAVSSLSRATESRNPPRPMMSDLRESGDIESEADMVCLLYREEYYKATEENMGLAEMILGKHRHGPTGTVKLLFMKEMTKFENYYEG